MSKNKTRHFDYFVIGAGSGGVRSARIAATHGAKTGIAECSNLGGTCVNLGCVPKKLMAYAADYHAHFEDSRGYGWDAPQNIPFDWNTLIENKNKEISRLNGMYKKTLENAGVEIINGFAKFVDEHTLDINGQIVTADKILIAVGSTPNMPDIEGGHLMAYSDTFFHWPHPPKKAVILGGGYIAVEFAHILKGLGVEITLLYRGDLFLRGFDRDIREILAEEMRKQGIDLRFNTNIIKVEQDGAAFHLHTTTGETLSCDFPIAAIGRTPKTEGLGLQKLGIKMKYNGQIETDENYRTSIPHIYAVGDVTNHANLTPVAIKEGHALADNLFSGQSPRCISYDNITTAVFSAPPIGTVGLSEEEALDKGYKTAIYQSNFRPMKYTLAGRDERSLMKLVVDAETDKVLGVHMIGLDAPEIIQGFAVALNSKATKADFDRTMAIHPTSAEEFVLMRTKAR